MTFHNGKPFTSEDVRFSFETIGAEESTSQWKPRVDDLGDRDPDDRTVVFTLASVFTPFLGTLARIPIVPSNVPYTVGDTYAADDRDRAVPVHRVDPGRPDSPRAV